MKKTGKKRSFKVEMRIKTTGIVEGDEWSFDSAPGPQAVE